MSDDPFTVEQRTFHDDGHTTYRLRGGDGHLVTVTLARGMDDPAHLRAAYLEIVRKRYVHRGRSTPPRI